MFICLTLNTVFGAGSGDVVINEIGWMGTAGGGAGDQWIELYNKTPEAIYFNRWFIENESYEKPEWYILHISGTIPAKGYFLIERTENCIKDITADFLYRTMYLTEKGEKLTLKDASGKIIDVAGSLNAAWYAGIRKNPRYSMERTAPELSGRDPNNWHNNNGAIKNGIDRKGLPVNGTPKSKNSSAPEIRKELIGIKILNSMIPPLMVDYTVPPGSMVSLRIFSKDRLIKTLVNEQSILTDNDPNRDGLQASCVWDEKDAYGERVIPGEYMALLEVSLKGAGKSEFLFSEPIKIKYIPIK